MLTSASRFVEALTSGLDVAVKTVINIFGSYLGFIGARDDVMRQFGLDSVLATLEVPTLDFNDNIETDIAFVVPLVSGTSLVFCRHYHELCFGTVFAFAYGPGAAKSFA